MLEANRVVFAESLPSMTPDGLLDASSVAFSDGASLAHGNVTDSWSGRPVASEVLTAVSVIVAEDASSTGGASAPASSPDLRAMSTGSEDGDLSAPPIPSTSQPLATPAADEALLAEQS
ncbi:MAG: hypothetical protein JSV80_03350 [Acidobacteriota bacterium]|nr:MAG: hypothetical protein JSV80_03350 [Acidobacteriota bacterium]